MNTFGERLAQLRMQRGLSQTELSTQLAISKSTLAMYETNRREPNFDTLCKLSDFLQVSIDYLLTGKPVFIYPVNPNSNKKELYRDIPVLHTIPVDDEALFQDSNIANHIPTDFSYIETNHRDFDYIWIKPQEPVLVGASSFANIWVLIELRSVVKSGELAAVCVNSGHAVIRRVFYTDEGITLDNQIRYCTYLREQVKIRGRAVFTVAKLT